MLYSLLFYDSLQHLNFSLKLLNPWRLNYLIIRKASAYLVLDLSSEFSINNLKLIDFHTHSLFWIEVFSIVLILSWTLILSVLLLKPLKLSQSYRELFNHRVSLTFLRWGHKQRFLEKLLSQFSRLLACPHREAIQSRSLWPLSLS